MLFAESAHKKTHDDKPSLGIIIIFANIHKAVHFLEVALSGYVSDETGKAPNAYCWIAEGTKQVKFAVLAQQNMTEEALLRNASFHGDAPRTNLCGYGTANVEWGRKRNIDGIPGLMIEGEYEWWQARIRPAQAFQMMYPGACISFLCDAGSGHFDLCEATIDYIARFIRKAIEQRLNADGSLNRLDPANGWRYGIPSGGETEGANITAFPALEPAPWNDYTGDPHEAFWYFDEEMARLTAARYAETDGKQMTVMDLRQIDYSHLDVGETFTMEAGWEYVYICGPVRKVSAQKFELIPYDCGMDNPKRSHNAWIAAIQPATKTHKRVVQPIQIKLK